MSRRILIANTCKRANKNHVNVQRKQKLYYFAKHDFVTNTVYGRELFLEEFAYGGMENRKLTWFSLHGPCLVGGPSALGAIWATLPPSV